ncbi:MAG: YhdP family protein [Methylophilaceae bacterium]
MLAIKKTFRWISYIIILLLTLMFIAATIIRFVVFPNIDQYKDRISTKITQKIGLKTTIGDIVTDWDGLSPSILIRELDIYDAENTSALHLENIKGTFSWLSIPMMHPHLSYISVRNPKLTIHRKADGNVYIAGIALSGNGEPDLANWLLSQANISVKNAEIIWQDDLRQAPALSLNNVYFNLKNPAWRKIFGQHLFSLSALPSVGTKHRVNVNGSFFGRDVSKIQTWRGNLNLKTKKVDLTAWKPWLDYPFDLKTGAGDTDVSMFFKENHIYKLRADIAIQGLLGKIESNKKSFEMDALSGLIIWEKDKKTTTITAQNIKLKTKGKVDVENGYGSVSQSTRNGKPWLDATLKLDAFNLGFLKELQQVVTLPKEINEPLTALAPSGQLSNLAVSWQGDLKNPKRYRADVAFNALSIKAYKAIPGFKNLSGRLDANQENGLLDLTTSNASLDFKNVLRWPIPVKKLSGKVTWKLNNDKLKVMAKEIYLANHHLSGIVNSTYDMNGIKGGYLDLSAKFDHGDAKFAPFYYPFVMGEDTISWLDSSILSGKANDIQLTVKGNLEDFPYVNKQNKPDPKLGVFSVSARIDDAVLEYGSNWPIIKGLGLDMLFQGNSMELNADKGKIFDVNIIKSNVVIPRLNTYGKNNQILTIVSEAAGPVEEGIKFINASPVKEVTLGFTDGLKTAGNGKLNLSISIPLNKIADAKYKGEYTINDGVMYANDNIGIPEMTNINGKLTFDEMGINAKNVNAAILGGPVQFNLTTKADKTIHIDADGTVSGLGIKKAMSNTFTESLDGTAKWSGTIAIKKPLVDLGIRSNLLGLAVNLPAPLGKVSQQEANFTITKKQLQADHDMFEIAYNDTLFANILRRDLNGTLIINRGDIAINTPSKTPVEPGLALRGKFDYLNADEWLALLDNPGDDNKQSTLALKKVDLSIQKLEIFNRSLNALNVTAKPNDGHLLMSLTSKELDGDIEWQSANSTEDSGKLIAKLKKLHIPASNEEEVDSTDNEVKRLDKKYPALDITADDFKLGKKILGKLELNAFESNEDWVIEKLKIHNPDSTLIAEGTWHNWAKEPNTNLKFTLTADDVGNTLKRFGQADAVKGGVAIISGRLQWPGSPHEFKKEDLNGEFTLGASKGEILKVKPGVGRLLGLLTLQSLPRRLTLDFRDLFSEGFAFDQISATAKINSGIMRSDDFFMTGPAAETKIKGETNLKTETQNFKVTVVPHISDTLSLAALVGGPIAGAAAFIAQKILKDPLNKIAKSEYTIVGTWDEPIEVGSKTNAEKNKPKNSPLNAQQN